MKKKLLFFTMLAIFTLLFSTAVMAAPSTPAGLKQTGDSTSSFTVEWNTTLENNIKYEVSVREYGSTDWIVKQDSQSSTSYRLSGLPSGKSYEVRIRAKDGSGAYSNYTSPLVVVTTPEVTGTITQTNATVNSVTFTWTKSEGATVYEVYKVYDGVYTLLGTTTANSYTYSGLNNKAKVIYNIAVKPIRTSPTYKAVETSRYTWKYHYFNARDMKLVPAKMGEATIPYHWNNIKEAKISFADAIYNDGYQVEIYNAKGKKIQTLSSNTGYVYNISRTSMYKAKARAYVVVNNKKYYGAWSDYTWFANAVKISRLKISGSKLKISWKKQKGAQKYTVYVSTSEKSGFKKVKTTKKSSLTLKKFKGKKFKKRKHYYAYVVASKKVGKKTYKSSTETYRVYKY